MEHWDAAANRLEVLGVVWPERTGVDQGIRGAYIGSVVTDEHRRTQVTQASSVVVFRTV